MSAGIDSSDPDADSAASDRGQRGPPRGVGGSVVHGVYETSRGDMFLLEPRGKLRKLAASVRHIRSL